MFLDAKSLELINNGGIAEQLVGQELLAYDDPTTESDLYYWRREAKSSDTEIDCLIQRGSKVIPVKVKAGASGTLKSLRIFPSEKKQCASALRFYSGPFRREHSISHFPLYAVRAALDLSI